MNLRIVVLLLSLLEYGYCYEKHMTCNDIVDDFSIDSNAFMTAARGPPGVTGDQGPPGLTGLPATIDKERLDQIVAARVAEETRELKIKLDGMELQIQNLTQDMKENKCTGVIYDEKCFWAEVYSTRDTDFDEAVKQCRRKNSELGNVYSERHYNMIMLYLAAKLELREYILIWTGMRKIYENDVAQLSNGTAAPFTQPRELDDQWRKADAKRTHVYVQVVMSQGMGALWPSYKLHGALCQYDI